MNELEKMEKRWKELLSRPNSKEEIEEVKILAKKIELERAKEYQGLILELKEIGIEIDSIWDLVNTKESYPKAVPLLIKYLPKIDYDRSKEGIVRALTVKEAKGIACKPIIDEYNKIPKDKKYLRWAFGNAMGVIITEDYINDVINIVQDETNGDSRQMFVRALGKLKTPKAKEVLSKLVEDENQIIRKEALKALKKFK